MALQIAAALYWALNFLAWRFSQTRLWETLLPAPIHDLRKSFLKEVLSRSLGTPVNLYPVYIHCTGWKATQKLQSG